MDRSCSAKFASAALLAAVVATASADSSMNTSLEIVSSAVGVSTLTPSPITLTPSLLSPSPIVTNPPPPLPSPPLHAPPAMLFAPIVYLIAVPVVLCILLAIIVILICCIICCYQRRRKIQRNKSQRSKSRNSVNRLDKSKSLEAYGGHSNHSVGKSTEESTRRYELQTVDGAGRFSEASLPSPVTHSSSKTLPAISSRSHADTWNSSPQKHHGFYPHSSHPHLGTGSPQHTLTSPLHSHTHSHQRLQNIPEAAIPNTVTTHGKTASLPHSYTEGDPSNMLDPSSVYDVPASARGKVPGVYPTDTHTPHSLYDIPRGGGGAGASSHYKVPPQPQSITDAVYDVPPSTSAIYDVPPNAYHPYNQGSELYDVPPNVQRPYNQGSELYDVPPNVQRPYNQGSELYDVPPNVQRPYNQGSELYDVPPNVQRPYNQGSELYDVPPNAYNQGSEVYDVPPNVQRPYNQGSELYDVPPNVQHPYNQGSELYDVPPNVQHPYNQGSELYDVPPNVQRPYNQGSELYDVPPNVQHPYNQGSELYDVPPNVQRPYNQGSELYDVPPPSASRPRLNSQPLSQEELVEARKSLVAVSHDSDSVFAAVDYSHYDTPRHLLGSGSDMDHYQQPTTTGGGKRLSRRNSSPSHHQNNMIYDVPRDARAAPQTSAKPTRKRTPPSRSHSIASPPNIASPERRPYPNEAFYDVPPLDPEFLAQRNKQYSQTSTSSESDTSHLTRTANQMGAAPHDESLSPSMSGRRVPPPPTKRKPGRRGDSIRK